MGSPFFPMHPECSHPFTYKDIMLKKEFLRWGEVISRVQGKTKERKEERSKLKNLPKPKGRLLLGRHLKCVSPTVCVVDYDRIKSKKSRALRFTPLSLNTGVEDFWVVLFCFHFGCQRSMTGVFLSLTQMKTPPANHLP